jgi:hypothetical protein
MTTTLPNCLIRHTDCGLQAGQTECPKCGLRTDVRYVSKEDMDRSIANAKSLYWKNHAQTIPANNMPQPDFLRESLAVFWLDRLKFISQNAYRVLIGWTIALGCSPDDMVHRPVEMHRKWHDRLWLHLIPFIFVTALLFLTACGKKEDAPAPAPRVDNSSLSLDQRVDDIERTIERTIGSHGYQIDLVRTKLREKELLRKYCTLAAVAWFLLIFTQRLVFKGRVRLSKDGIVVVRLSLGPLDLVKSFTKWGDVLTIDYDGDKWRLKLDQLNKQRPDLSFQTGSACSLRHANQLRNEALFIAFALAYGRDDLKVYLINGDVR